MMDQYDRYKTSVLGVHRVWPESISSYGIVDGNQLHDGFYSINRLVEKPNHEDAPSNLAMIGRYILTPSIFDFLEHQEEGVGKEIQLTDAISKLNEFEAVYAIEIAGIWHDVGDHWGYVKSMLTLASQREDLKHLVIEYLRSVMTDD